MVPLKLNMSTMFTTFFFEHHFSLYKKNDERESTQEAYPKKIINCTKALA